MSNWSEEAHPDGTSGSRLVRRFEFNDFVDAWAFMNKVAITAEKHNHHPNWSNVYNKVEIALSTHDVGNVVTERDRELARKIDELYEG